MSSLEVLPSILSVQLVPFRSQSLGDQLQVFEAEAAVLKSWLTAARSKLTSIKQLSSTDLRSIATVRNKIDKILVSLHDFNFYCSLG